MSMNRVANMLSALKNSSMAQKGFAEVIYTKECEEIAKVLKSEGYLANVKIFKPEGTAYRMLRLDLERGSFTEVRGISKPGRRVYKTSRELGRFSNKAATTVVSTSRGILSGAEARKKKLGGEVLCEVY